MTAPATALIPAQPAVPYQTRDPHRRDGYGNPHLAGTMLRVLAGFWAIVGVSSAVFAVVILAGFTSGTRHKHQTDEETAAETLAGIIAGAPFVVAAFVCLVLAAIFWFASVRFRWMAALYSATRQRR